MSNLSQLQVQGLAAPLEHVNLLACSSAAAAAPGIVYQVVGSWMNGSAANASSSIVQCLAPMSQQQHAVQLIPPVSQQATTAFGKQQHNQQQQQQQQLPATIFFAGVTPVADGQRLRLLFSQFGHVMDLNLFRPYNGCRTSKGCGLVVFSQQCEAAAALDALNGRFVWPGARSPMVIEWCDPTKQHKKKRARPLAHTIMQQSAMRWQLQMQQTHQATQMNALASLPAPRQNEGLQMVYISHPQY